MTILDISQSFYIFRQQIIIEVIETVFCTGFIIFLLFRLTKRIKITNSKLQEIGWTILGILLTATIYFTYFYPSINKTLNLKNDGIEISGKTVQWINTNDSRMIEYSFVLNGQTYNKICDVVYNGKEIEGIICPDGKYVVICDTEDPDNSIMDFKRPAK